MSNQKNELVSRLKAKKKALEADFAQMNADAQGEVNEKKINGKQSECAVFNDIRSVRQF